MEANLPYAITNSERISILVFALEEPRFALLLSTVERVIQAVEITQLPQKQPFILGVINFHGQVIPVLDIRSCFGMLAHEIQLNDQFILAHTSNRLIALVADTVIGVLEIDSQMLVITDQEFPGVSYIHGLAKVKSDLVLLCDLDQFLSLEGAQKIESVLKEKAEKTKRRNKRKMSVLV